MSIQPAKVPTASQPLPPKHFWARDLVSSRDLGPREVEAVLQDLAGGKQCFVVGVPDDLRGQIVVAILVDDQNDGVDEKDLQRRSAEKLSQYKIPRRILRFERADIPVLSSGKVDVRALTSTAQQRCRETTENR